MGEGGLSVLLVEDDDVAAEAVERVLASKGFTESVRRAVDGREALDMLRGANGERRIPYPRLTLLDLNMPRMGGLRFLDELRADPTLADSVVFVLTSSAEDSDRAQTYARNVAGYIVKSRAGGTLQGVAELLCAYAKTVRFPPDRGE